MTHGAGSFGGGGGGGGGGFSGGGFSYNTAVYHGSRRRSNSGHDSSDGGGCCFLCIAVAYLIGFFLCLLDMKPRTRIVLVWLYCILGAGLGGGLLASKYSQHDVSASPTDMREVTGISPLFCYEIDLISSVPMPTYLFYKEPVINKLAFSDYTYSTNTQIIRDNYEYWGYYLLDGSKVTVEACPGDYGMSLYIIKGKKNLDKWINDPYCDGSTCYRESSSLSPCRYDNFKIDMEAHGSDDYYFAFVNRDPFVDPPMSLSVTFSLKRTRYDLNQSQLLCYDEILCSIPLITDSKEHFVYEIPRDSPRDVDVTISCLSRSYMYIILFGLLPTILGSILTVGILVYAKKKRQREDERSRSDSQVFSISVNDSNPLNVNNSYTNPVAQVQSPPKYAEQPPSYDQIFGAQATNSS
ncbi:Peptidyl-prolyl isomerase cwc27 [Mactra antiquata]